MQPHSLAVIEQELLAMPKQFSVACERNQAPILQVLREALADCKTVLEIGSDSGQHGLFFSAQLPHLIW